MGPTVVREVESGLSSGIESGHVRIIEEQQPPSRSDALLFWSAFELHGDGGNSPAVISHIVWLRGLAVSPDLTNFQISHAAGVA